MIVISILILLVMPLHALQDNDKCGAQENRSHFFCVSLGLPSGINKDRGPIGRALVEGVVGRWLFRAANSFIYVLA
jgi:hypothetical protein